MVKIVVAQYEIEQLPQWQAFEDKMVRLVEQAKENDAHLLLLSEFVGIEIASWSHKRSFKEQLNFIQTELRQYHQLFQSLTKEYQLYIQPGTIPVEIEDGTYRNRAFLFSPDGKFVYQDKIFLTPFEIDLGFFSPGENLQCFNTDIGKIGINICYDIEFPLLAQSLTELGAKLILVPTYTGKMSGLTRVSITARARAIENQCYVAQSCLIGKSSWSDFIDIGVGQSGIYGPADLAFTENGILAQSQFNTPMLIEADLDWEKIGQVRKQGETSNFKDLQRELNVFVTTNKI